jgi:hypothetical protein
VSGKVSTPDGKKMPGWFSWRHETNAEHVAARSRFLLKRGRAARQRRAADRLLPFTGALR